jgi:phosphate transport system protein
MSVYFLKEMDKIKNEVLALGAMVEGELHKSVIAMIERDPGIAEEVIAKDKEVDAKEVEIEEELLKVLALNQPVAQDLRFLIATLKINNDMERIGDLAVNIAERAKILSAKAQCPVPVDLATMSEVAESMVRQSIDALVKLDANRAAEVCQCDDQIDNMYIDCERILMKEMEKATDPDMVDILLGTQQVCRDLERIGDHATNIAEDVVYMCQGRIIRHHIHEYVAEKIDNK